MKWINKIKDFLSSVPSVPVSDIDAPVEAISSDTFSIGTNRIAESCPYCFSKNFVKRGTRKNRHQIVQLYLCRNPECAKTFTAQDVKGKHFPLNVVIEGMSYYNLGYTFEETCAILRQKFGVNPEPATLSSWVDEYKELCRYERLRPYAVKMYKPKDTVEVVTMAHRQLYRFRYHRAKTALMLEEFGNRNLRRLKEYLDAVSSETPHQYFQDGERMSEVRSKFDTADMIVKSKTNFANRLAAFVLQAVSENKARHEAVQRFFLANDSVTVATEVPVYIRKEDIEHMENVLNFKILGEGGLIFKGDKEKDSTGNRLNAKATSARGRLLTGHIDLVQIRNGQVHILDYKPGAAKERPIEQLTWYALALSRLTGLRLFEFTCAWFDEKDYYQFFPLHVVKKLQPSKAKRPRKRIVRFRDGTAIEVPRKNVEKVTIV
ncbi:MAG: PD-(D/E)XK nuclease family protein [Candidatus Sungiibacteriota bacterium]